MNSQSLKKLLLSGESETVEFKTSFGKEAIETLVAFANTKGGTILIGVNDKGEVAGGKIGQEIIQNWVNQIKQNSSPSIIPDHKCPVKNRIILVAYRYTVAVFCSLLL